MTPETPESKRASTGRVAALFLAAVLIAAALVAAMLILGRGDDDASQGVPSGMSFEMVVSANSLGDGPRGISQDGLAALFIEDGQLCRLTIESSAIDCLEVDAATRVAVTAGAAVWSMGAGPVVENRRNFLLSPRVLDFDTGTEYEPFDDDIIRAPLDMDGDRILLLEETDLVITDLDGREREVIAVLSSTFTFSGRLDRDVVVIANSDRDAGLTIERHSPTASTVRVPVDAQQGAVLDVSSDFSHAIALDLDRRNFLKPGALLLVDFESRSTTPLHPPREIDPEAFGELAWFSDEGDVVYAVFFELSSKQTTLVAAELDQIKTTEGEPEWSVLGSWPAEDQPAPGGIFALAGIPSDGSGFLFIDNDAIYRMTPTYDN